MTVLLDLPEELLDVIDGYLPLTWSASFHVYRHFNGEIQEYDMWFLENEFNREYDMWFVEE